MIPALIAAILATIAPDPGHDGAVRVDTDRVRAAQVEAFRWHHPDPDVDRWWPTFTAAGWPVESAEWVLNIVGCESGGNPDLVGPYLERGLMQIHPRSWAGEGRRRGMPVDTWFDPATNARMALVVFAAGGPTMWTCHRLTGRLDPQISQTQAAWLTA
jgi:hypothetical protein